MKRFYCLSLALNTHSGGCLDCAAVSLRCEAVDRGNVPGNCFGWAGKIENNVQQDGASWTRLEMAWLPVNASPFHGTNIMWHQVKPGYFLLFRHKIDSRLLFSCGSITALFIEFLFDDKWTQVHVFGQNKSFSETKVSGEQLRKTHSKRCNLWQTAARWATELKTGELLENVKTVQMCLKYLFPLFLFV